MDIFTKHNSVHFRQMRGFRFFAFVVLLAVLCRPEKSFIEYPVSIGTVISYTATCTHTKQIVAWPANMLTSRRRFKIWRGNCRSNDKREQLCIILWPVCWIYQPDFWNSYHKVHNKIPGYKKDQKCEEDIF